jgi:hypothetical protein
MIAILFFALLFTGLWLRSEMYDAINHAKDNTELSGIVVSLVMLALACVFWTWFFYYYY